MNIDQSLLDQSEHSSLHDIKSPIQMHHVQHKSHGQKILVLKVNDVPLIGWKRCININVSQQAEWKDDYSAENPNNQHRDVCNRTNN